MGKGKMKMLFIRMEPETIAVLDSTATALKISRSKLLRDMARNAASFYSFIVAEKVKQQTGKILLDGNITNWVLQNYPPGTDSRLLHFLSVVMHLAAEAKEGEEKKEKEFYTVKGLADLLSLSEDTVRRRLQRREIKGVKVGGKGEWRITSAEVDRQLTGKQYNNEGGEA